MGKTERNLIKRLSNLEGEESWKETIGTLGLGIITLALYGSLLFMSGESTTEQYSRMNDSSSSSETGYSTQN